MFDLAIVVAAAVAVAEQQHPTGEGGIDRGLHADAAIRDTASYPPASGRLTATPSWIRRTAPTVAELVPACCGHGRPCVYEPAPEITVVGRISTDFRMPGADGLRLSAVIACTITLALPSTDLGGHVSSSPTQWWKTFFDERYVDAWEADGSFDHTSEDAALLMDFLGLDPGAAILDIPCGFGRFAGPLQEAGHRVVGVDASPAQIRLAHERHPGPRYVVGDMREPPSGPFDAVLNLYSSFGYFDDPNDDLACLRAWHAVLRPGGVLILETMHRDKFAWLWGQEVDPGVRRESGRTDWATGVRTACVHIDGVERTFRVRLYTATELVGMMTEAGFNDVEVYGALDGRPLDPSSRLVIRARR